MSITYTLDPPTYSTTQTTDTNPLASQLRQVLVGSRPSREGRLDTDHETQQIRFVPGRGQLKRDIRKVPLGPLSPLLPDGPFGPEAHT